MPGLFFVVILLDLSVLALKLWVAFNIIHSYWFIFCQHLLLCRFINLLLWLHSKLTRIHEFIVGILVQKILLKRPSLTYAQRFLILFHSSDLVSRIYLVWINLIIFCSESFKTDAFVRNLRLVNGVISIKCIWLQLRTRIHLINILYFIINLIFFILLIVQNRALFIHLIVVRVSYESLFNLIDLIVIIVAIVCVLFDSFRVVLSQLIY